MLKYRADKAVKEADGSVVWFSEPWHVMAKIDNCRVCLAGDPRGAVYITGEPDTWFSIPAVMSYLGKRMKGYVTSDDDGLIFHAVYY
jgi:hypothetical protein